jgi:hypothetical protein
MNIEIARSIIAKLDVETLAVLSDETLIELTSTMNKEDKARFFIEKNIKIFGGINAYIEDIIENTNIHKLSRREKRGVRDMLTILKTYPGISPNNKLEIERAIHTTRSEPGAAAGGKRRTRRPRRTRRTRRK